MIKHQREEKKNNLNIIIILFYFILINLINDKFNKYTIRKYNINIG